MLISLVIDDSYLLEKEYGSFVYFTMKNQALWVEARNSHYPT
jgi:hypothetical protein